MNLITRKSFLLGIGVFVAAAAIPILSALPKPIVDVIRPGELIFSEEVTVREPGDELVLVYLGKRFCAPSNIPEIPEAVRLIQDSISKRAQEQSLHYVSIGVGLDSRPEDSWIHLRQIGGFHEMMMGRHWLSLAADEFIWNRYPGPPSTPQILIIRRESHLPSDSSLADPAVARGLDEGRMIIRLTGADEILHWVENGARIGQVSRQDEEELEMEGS